MTPAWQGALLAVEALYAIEANRIGAMTQIAIGMLIVGIGDGGSWPAGWGGLADGERD